MVGVGRERLGAVENPVAVIARGSRPPTPDIRSPRWFGEPERELDLAGEERREEPLVLIRRPEADKRLQYADARYRMATERDALANSRISSTNSTAPPPLPPSSSGTPTPSNP
jgi:hypothetical protein